ncbi:MAG: inositol monophosphatase family protein [Promethearchaeota archaeon]
MSQYNREISLAVDLVKKASEITEWFKKKGVETYLKKDRSPATVADYSSQIYILSRLKVSFPKDQVIAEENEMELIDDNSASQIKECFNDLDINDITDLKNLFNYRGQKSARQWTVDPIDGTKGYMKGLKYAIGIGLMVNSDPKISVINVPQYKNNGIAIFTAEQGQGAKASYGGKNFESIHVSNQINLKKARLCQSLHYDLPWVTQFADKLGIEKRIKMDSMAKFCLVADGSYDLYIKPIMGFRAFTWDYGPGDLLVREAGGKVTDLDEERLVFKDEKCILRAPGIITSNGALHDEVAVFIRNKFFSI